MQLHIICLYGQLLYLTWCDSSVLFTLPAEQPSSKIVITQLEARQQAPKVRVNRPPSNSPKQTPQPPKRSRRQHV